MLWIPVAFLSGGLVGGFIGGFIGVNGAKKKIEELEKLLEEAKKEKTDLLNKFENQTNKALEEISEKVRTDTVDFVSRPPVSSIDSVKEETVVEAVQEKVGTRPPFRISEEAFRHELATVDDDTLIYYTKSGVLADNGGSEMTNPKYYIGDVFSELIDGVYDDEDKVFVHNEALEQNFEIEIDHSQNYYRDVAGSYDF